MYWTSRKRKIIVFAAILCVMHVQAMDYAHWLVLPDVTNMLEQPQITFDYLDKLPVDIQNLIVCLWKQEDALDRETKEEFIERIESKRSIREFESVGKVILAYCPCDTKVAELYLGPDEKHTLRIFEGLQFLQRITITDCAKEDFKYIALSSKAQMLATIAERFSGGKTKNILFLINLVEGDEYWSWSAMGFVKNCKKTREIDIGDMTASFFIDFNKQGTHIAVHGVDSNTQANVYKIFPLKTNMDIVVKLTPLQEYFREKGVCKFIGNGNQ